MSKVITLDKGSKRRLGQIRWKLVEIFSLALLAILGFAVSLLVLLGQLDHEHPHSEPTKVPQIRDPNPENRSTPAYSILQRQFHVLFENTPRGNERALFPKIRCKSFSDVVFNLGFTEHAIHECNDVSVWRYVIGCRQDFQPSIKRADVTVAEENDIVNVHSPNKRRNCVSPPIVH